jgi:hypothetical protein
LVARFCLTKIENDSFKTISKLRSVQFQVVSMHPRLVPRRPPAASPVPAADPPPGRPSESPTVRLSATATTFPTVALAARGPGVGPNGGAGAVGGPGAGPERAALGPAAVVAPGFTPPCPRSPPTPDEPPPLVPPPAPAPRYPAPRDRATRGFGGGGGVGGRTSGQLGNSEESITRVVTKES